MPNVLDTMANLNLRRALLQTGIRQKKKTGTFGESASPQGKTTRIRLFNTGVLTMISMIVTINLTIGTANATVSPNAPWNAIKQISVKDYSGQERVRLSGYQLWMINTFRKRTPAHLNNEGLSAVSTMPVVPTAQATADMKFYLEIPIAYQPDNDLTGAMLMQNSTGEAWVEITWNNAFHTSGSDDSVYNGAGGTVLTLNSYSVDLFQHFIMPQQIGNATPLPLNDFATVYALEGGIRLNDNMSNGMEKLIAYPFNRTVLSAHIHYQNNGAMSGALDKFKLYANGTQVLTEESIDSQLMTQREWINGDTKTGTFFLNHVPKPIQTAIMGQVQVGMTLTAAPTGNYHLSVAFESFIIDGSLMPGLSQS